MAIHHFPVAEEDDSGDAQDVVASGGGRVLVHVQLGDDDPFPVLLGQKADVGGHLMAGAAPVRPEIDDGQLFAAQDALVKVRVGHVDGARFGNRRFCGYRAGGLLCFQSSPLEELIEHWKSCCSVSHSVEFLRKSQYIPFDFDKYIRKVWR